ncbi:3033_t:CDS:1 [Funneliformis geosporum]|nr:3033_t:CDS:1 [Funneliformis geosporum]
MSEEKIKCKDCSRDITNEGGVSIPTDNGMVCQNCRTNYECCRQINCNIRVSKGAKKYCDKHKKEMECSECRKEVEDVYYSITIGDKLERDYNESKKFNLCQSH